MNKDHFNISDSSANPHNHVGVLDYKNTLYWTENIRMLISNVYSSEMSKDVFV